MRAFDDLVRDLRHASRLLARSLTTQDYFAVAATGVRVRTRRRDCIHVCTRAM